MLNQCLEKQLKLQGGKSTTLISDGALNFHEAWKAKWKAKNFLHKDY